MESVASVNQIATRHDRIPALDGLRALAIAAVFLHHAFRLPLLWAGVDVFFVLSGFLITGILLDRKAKSGPYFTPFYERRARRILPAYFIALLVLSLLTGWAWLRRWYWFVFLLTNIGESIQRSQFSLQPMWSLAVEEQFYLLWPLVVLLVSIKHLRWICIAALFAVPLLRVLCTPLFPNHFAIYYLTPFRMDLLCAGALLAILWREDSPRVLSFSRWWWVLVAFGIGFLLWVNRFPQWHTQSNSRTANGALFSITLLISAGLLLGALRGRGLFAGVLSLAPLRYLGIISYSMYLIHAGAIEWARDRFGQTWRMVLVAAAMTIVYASIAWFGWERRILRRRPA